MFSLTYTGRIVSLVMVISYLFGWDLDEGYATEVIQAILFLAGELLSLYGRWRIGGLKWWGARK